MPKVTIDQIKQLRDLTGAGMMAAKAALEESAGDLEAAQSLLRQKGQAAAGKRAAKETKAGLVDSYVHLGRVGVLIEVNCETDFVARTDDFKQFVHELALQIAAANPSYIAVDDVPAAEIKKEQAVYAADTKGKPADVAAKILAGKLEKYYSEVCLLQQPTIQDASQTVEDRLQQLISKLGENIVIKQFARFELGVS
ncbi:elongation factor Ts [Candidatus Microgenomates bacterium]|nr:elongation factor Ts [Candidatus Microgenomates bacterium]